MIRSRLKIIPTALTDLIQDILDRDKPTKYLVPLLQWVLFSRRPLTPEELFLALQSIESETIRDSHTPEALARDNIDKFILNTSKGLAEMTKGKKPKVQFIHELVRTHFLGPEGLAKLDPDLQTHLVGQSHDQLKECCYNYLMSEPCSHVTIPTELPKAESPDGKRLRSDTLGKLPFLQYALENILYHTDLAHLDSTTQLEFLESFPFDTWRELDNAIARFTSHRHAESVSQAYILAEQGCAALLAIAMQSRPQPEEPEERCRSILGAAVDSRDTKSVLAVLSQKGYENSLGKDNGICITHAIENGELGIVQALVAAKAKPYKVDAKSIKHYAAAKNNALVSAGSQPDKFASSLGRFGLLRLLSGSLSSEDRGTRSCIGAVEYASEEVCKYGDLEAFKLLPEVRASARASHLMLMEASATGNQQLVRTILQRGVHVNHVTGHDHFTALSAASKAGHEDIVRVLLFEGADPRIGWPMAWASKGGHASVVHTLLEHGVDVNAIDPYTAPHYGALQSACMKGHLDTARLLIQHGANINDANFVYGSPLALACESGHENIVQMLLQNDADINDRDVAGESPLTRAIICSRTEVARLLIEHGADIEQSSYLGGSPLFWATHYGLEATVRLLISKGANVYVSDNYGYTPLAIARRRNHANIINILIENGAALQANKVP
jgi:ankyrin repeat protein